MTCWSDQHFTHECKEGTKCRVCLLPGHKPGDEECSKYVKQHPSSVVLFRGKENVLSNLFPCTINVFGESFESAEHAFQCVKAIQSGDILAAEKIREAETALDAKRIGNLVTPSDAWIAEREKKMTEIIQHKAEQVEEFRSALEKTKTSTTFVETTYDDLWGCGLNLVQTMHTKVNALPGENLLGQIMSRVAAEHRKNKTTKSSQRSGSAPASQSRTRQRDISTMLQETGAQNQGAGGK